MKKRIVSIFVPVVVAFGCSEEPDDPTEDTAGAETSMSDTSSADTAPDASDITDPDTSGSDTTLMDTSSGDTSEEGDGGATDGGDAAESDIRFRITSPRSDRPVEYRLKVAEEPSKIRDGSRFEAEEDNDDIAGSDEDWLISGETGTAASSDQVYGDSYRWPTVQDPEYGIVGWSANAPKDDYTITINGTEVDPDALPELSDESGGQAGCLGGGGCYDDTTAAGDADHTVGASADLGDLRSTLQNASSGDVVFVDPQADIDMGFNPDSLSLEVPAGVTLASDRGVDGSSGARLTGDKKPGSDWEGSDTIGMNDDSRITGFRIEGPTPDRDMNWLGDDHDYTDGIDVSGASNVGIDNNEIYGWPQAAVSGGDPVHVHHNFIHDNDQSGLGYGVSSPQWDSIVEYNQFERNRHAIAGSGSAGDGYIVRHNVFGSEGIGGAGHKIDMHEDGNTGKGGSRMEIHHNTVKFPDAQGVYLRGTPRQNAEIYNNWFFNPTAPCLASNRSGGYCAIEVRASDWTNVDYYDNHYGDSEPSCDIGAPRDGC